MLDLWITNLPPSITEEQLAELFAEFGSVQQIVFSESVRLPGQLKKARVSLETDVDVQSIVARTLGIVLDERRMFVSSFEPPTTSQPNQDEHALHDFAQHLAQTLGETEPRVQTLIHTVVQICGVEFCRLALEEALVVQASGGLLVMDGSRQRTAGGVFFFLIKDLVSTPTRRAIFGDPPPRKQVRPKEKKKEKNTAPAAQSVQTPAAAKTAEQVEPAAPVQAAAVEPVDTALVQQKLVELRQSHRAAQQRLELIKAGKATQPGGMFSAIKEVLELQRQIEEIVGQYPNLA